jgi:hypothetical protein
MAKPYGYTKVRPGYYQLYAIPLKKTGMAGGYQVGLAIFKNKYDFYADGPITCIDM